MCDACASEAVAKAPRPRSDGDVPLIVREHRASFLGIAVAQLLWFLGLITVFALLLLLS